MIDNLDDGMTSDELFAWGHTIGHASKAMRVKLFGHSGIGTKLAAKALANYAANKGTAMACRTRGDIQTALQYEKICDSIYATLPDFAKW